MDAWLIAAVAAELRAEWLGSRISRIGQPTPRNVYLQLYTPGRNGYLLLSADPALDRAHLVADRPANAPVPLAFCQTLRRHVEGGRLLAVEQPGLERVLCLTLLCRDELGNPRPLYLHAELTGRLANLVLVGPGGVILDAVHRVSAETNRVRQLLPGLPYCPPPRPEGRLDPVLRWHQGGPAALAADLAEIWGRRPSGEAPEERLQTTVFGLSRPLARALAAWAGGAPGAPPLPPGLPATVSPLAGAVLALADSVHRGAFQPCVRDPHGDRPEPLAWPLPGVVVEPAASANNACAVAYERLAAARRLQALRQRLQAAVRTAAVRTDRRLAKQQEELAAAQAADAWREAGELLLAYPHLVARGANRVSLPSFLDPDRLVEIALDPRRNASGNAHRLLQRYQKERRARALVEAQLQAGRAEQTYLAEAAWSLEQAQHESELLALSAELQAQGVVPAEPVRGPAAARASRRPAPAPPLRLDASAGWEILIGRNATGNDQLTFRLGRPTDIWLHAKQMPGSHVLLRPPAERPGSEPPEEALVLAARCAAYFSAGRGGTRIPVDHTRRRSVWKPAGARPGFVLYSGERTLLVDPLDPRQLPAGPS